MISALSAMTADQVGAALGEPLSEKIAVSSAAASLGVDATADAIVAGIRGLGVDPAAGRLPTTEITVATLSAENRAEVDRFGAGYESYARSKAESAAA